MNSKINEQEISLQNAKVDSLPSDSEPSQNEDGVTKNQYEKHSDEMAVDVPRLVRSVFDDRSHTEKYPTQFISYEEKEKTYVWEWSVRTEVAKEEHEILMENGLWNRDIIHPSKSESAKNGLNVD